MVEIMKILICGLETRSMSHDANLSVGIDMSPKTVKPKELPIFLQLPQSHIVTATAEEP
jgi:hypothetical protein